MICSISSPVTPTRHARPRSPRKSARSSAARTRWPRRTQGASEVTMTATVENTAAGGGSVEAGLVGQVARVTGPVVDVEFPTEQMPDIYNALHVDVTLEGETKTLTLEIEQHLGENMVRAISMQPTDGLVRGATVTDTGGPISVPVGDVTKGHVFNVLGETLD